MRILLFLAHFAMLLFSAYFYFNFDVRWVQVIDYNLAFNEPVANSLNHSINIYFKLIAITSFSYLFFALFSTFLSQLCAVAMDGESWGYSGNIYLLWMRYKSTDYDGIFQTSSFIFIFYAHYCLSLLSYLYCKK